MRNTEQKSMTLADMLALRRELDPDAPDAIVFPDPPTVHPGEFAAVCDRCKDYMYDCLRVAYNRPLPLVPPPTEPMIGPDYITERVFIDRGDMRHPIVVMCAECRAAKALFSNRDAEGI